MNRRHILLRGAGFVAASILPMRNVARATERDFSGQYVSATPLHEITKGTITPNNLAFIRNHAGVPEIKDDEHHLVVHGLVDTPLTFTMGDINRFPSITCTHFLECGGNDYGLVQNAEFMGVLLRDILNEVGLKDSARWVMAEGSDDAAMNRSIPLSRALDDCMVVYRMNGEALPPEHGGPLRLLVPGCQGNLSIKWLSRLKVGDRPWYTREETSRYTVLLASGKTREFSFVMDAKSVIVAPSPQTAVLQHGPNTISGFAWSGRGKIARVDVSLDGGQNWFEASLEGSVLSKAFVRFNARFDWNGQEMVVMSRAMDETGYVQPSLAELTALRGQNGFYHNNAIQSWRIHTGGSIESV